jgi:pyruvate/2-oxoglutarate dehydrogenase complex dihydrolipoamide acyltransferase (E2) component
MPKLSPTMEEGQLARWLKKEGDKVSMGEPLAEIDTDKATMEMQALSNGVSAKILVQLRARVRRSVSRSPIIGEADEDISELLKSGGRRKRLLRSSRRSCKTSRNADTAPAVEQKNLPRKLKLATDGANGWEARRRGANAGFADCRAHGREAGVDLNRSRAAVLAVG